MADDFGNAIGNAIVGDLQPSTPAPSGNSGTSAQSNSSSASQGIVDTADGGSTGTTTDPLTKNDNPLFAPVQMQDIQVDPNLVPQPPTLVMAQPNAGITDLMNSSDPVAVEAFQRANGMSGTDFMLQAGQYYVLPGADDWAAAEADGGLQGQATLDASNSMLMNELQPVSVTASLIAAPIQTTAATAPVQASGGFLAENQASADAYWSGVQDSAVSQGSLLEYAGAGIMQKLAAFGYGVAQTAVAMYNDPGSAAAGAGKAIVNFGPQLFNGVTDLAKTSLDGLTLLAEQTPLVPDGEFAGFRSTDPYNIPLLAPYTNQAEVGGAVLANLVIGTALGEFGDVSLQSPITAGDSVPYAFGQSGAVSFRLQSPIAPSASVDPLNEIAPNEEVAPAAPTSTVVSPEQAQSILVQNGMSADRAADYVASFDGLITTRMVDPGESFLRYTDSANSTGSFLTQTQFPNPSAAVDGLYLEPYGNGASFVQTVTSIARTPVLEGGILNGGPGVQQTLIVDRSAFNFGQGVGY